MIDPGLSNLNGKLQGSHSNFHPLQRPLIGEVHPDDLYEGLESQK